MNPPPTVLEILQKTTEYLGAKGVESPRLQAELLVGHALKLKRMQLYLQFERNLAEAELALIRPLVRRRALREPLQYIVGETEWCGLTLKVDARALIPRPETEQLVELVEARAGSAPGRILDLGTGTGAIALALAVHWPEAEVVALDASAEALALARENAAANGLCERVRWVESDWFSALGVEERFDLIVANPPYLTAREVEEAEPEVKSHEPRGALVAAAEGCADLLRIIDGAAGRLTAGGMLALETGIAQHATLRARAGAAGFSRSESRKDLTGRDRFVLAWR